MHCNSACTFGLSARGILLGVLKAKGCEFNWILYSRANVPRPVNNEAYCEIMFLSIDSTCDNKLNKNTLGVKKVRGQSEAVLQIGMCDQKL